MLQYMVMKNLCVILILLFHLHLYNRITSTRLKCRFAGAQSDLREVQVAQSAEDIEFVFRHRSARMPVAPSISHQTWYVYH